VIRTNAFLIQNEERDWETLNVPTIRAAELAEHEAPATTAPHRIIALGLHRVHLRFIAPADFQFRQSWTGSKSALCTGATLALEGVGTNFFQVATNRATPFHNSLRSDSTRKIGVTLLLLIR
jgi:hypothetical protein